MGKFKFRLGHLISLVLPGFLFATLRLPNFVILRLLIFVNFTTSTTLTTFTAFIASLASFPLHVLLAACSAAVHVTITAHYTIWAELTRITAGLLLFLFAIGTRQVFTLTIFSHFVAGFGTRFIGRYQNKTGRKQTSNTEVAPKTEASSLSNEKKSFLYSAMSLWQKSTFVVLLKLEHFRVMYHESGPLARQVGGLRNYRVCFLLCNRIGMHLELTLADLFILTLFGGGILDRGAALGRTLLELTVVTYFVRTFALLGCGLNLAKWRCTLAIRGNNVGIDMGIMSNRIRQ
jgi:hypothetical protein